MEDINQAVRMMGNGMLGIFVVIGLIAVVVTLLGRLGNRKP
ncbi:MAG: sodium pump decarboxylase gamma subunit [Acutalibacter sp.]|nr:sodium pump decarboxylase gamma subunit [Acutalibacter sp.]